MEQSVRLEDRRTEAWICWVRSRNVGRAGSRPRSLFDEKVEQA